MIRNKLDTEVQFLPGVGPKRASLLKSELGVSTVGDLLRTFPFRYIDRSTIQRIADIQSTSAYVQILAQARLRLDALGGDAESLVQDLRDAFVKLGLVHGRTLAVPRAQAGRWEATDALNARTVAKCWRVSWESVASTSA